MRLISQRDMVDIPYEQSVLISIDGIIRAVFDGKTYIIGEYAPDEADLEMGKIVSAYMEGRKVYQLSERELEE